MDWTNEWVVVLNDGETFTSLRGCVVLRIPPNLPEEDVDEWVKEHSHEGLPISDLDIRPSISRSIR